MSLWYFYIDCFFIAILLILILKSLKHRNKKAVSEFIILMVLSVIALTFFSASLVIEDFKIKTFVHEMKFIGAAFFSVCFYDMYLSFWGRKLSRKKLIILSIIPALAVVFALTNNYHHLFREGFYIVNNDWGNFVCPRPAIAFYIYIAYIYMLYLYDVTVVLMLYFKTPRIYRQQSGLMFLTATITLVANVISISGIIFDDFGDISLIVLAISNIVHYFCLVEYKPQKMIQLARGLAIGEIKNPIIIFDYLNIFFEANPTAHKDFKIEKGESLENFFKNRLNVQLQQELLNGDVDMTCVVDDVYYSVSIKRAVDEEGVYSGSVLLFNNITEMKKKETMLQEMALKDYLTGFPNRRLFTERLYAVTDDRIPISIIFFDINRMKLINSMYGINYGDSVIKKVSLLLDSKMEEGIFSHFEGGLFAVMLENCNEEKAYAFVDCINTVIIENESLFKYKIRLNYGLAVKASSKDNIQFVMKAAMDNLNHNKLIANSADAPEFSDMVKHLQRVRISSTEKSEFCKNLSDKVGKKLNLKISELADLKLLNEMKNIGLISIPKEIAGLQEFTDEEYEIYKLHALRGYNIALTAKELSCIVREILTHHEDYDGSGYPNGLRGEEIPILSRILSLCNRAAHLIVVKKMTSIEAIEIIKEEASKYDPNVLKAFLDIME